MIIQSIKLIINIGSVFDVICKINLIMKKIQITLVLLLFFTLLSCPKKDSENTPDITARETRTVNVTYSLSIEHDETIALKSLQDITTYYPGTIQEITITGEYTETIAGLQISSGDEVKLAFTDVTDCHPQDDCIYVAILSISLNGTIVASGRFDCRDGQGMGEVKYTFE